MSVASTGLTERIGLPGGVSTGLLGGVMAAPGGVVRALGWLLRESRRIDPAARLAPRVQICRSCAIHGQDK